ncbi:MAG TPA: GspE/PulE family protein [Isosphaeraceae bacterium]|jgi:type II secretory ATPase GspE/PulE/Tfp pilus assembly ATPase PilB-like protein|nr:GspE/PulE family protein [Isosphaeraceae bacterium]
MPSAPVEALRQALTKLDATSPKYVIELVDLTLASARSTGSSDVHWQPTADGLEVRWRVDGVLQAAAMLPAAIAPNVVARLKVLADLLTYRTDVPQEGRIRGAPGDVEMRVSTFPTLYGEKAVVRLFAESGRFLRLDDLGLPAEVRETLDRLLGETSGAILLAGPAGSGKTTTIYACLRELVEHSGGTRSLVTLEDPIEVAVPGVAQSQVNPTAGFTLATGLRSLMRQDPEVIAVGEIRDRETAEVAFQASLTGHLVLSTFHAGSAVGVIGRLSDMGIEPYLLRSGVLAIVCQRLVRKLCDQCARDEHDPKARLALPVRRVRMPVGCEHCGATGYRGRMVLAEVLVPDQGELGRAILSRTDVPQLESLAVETGMITRWQRACRAIEAGLTSPAEVRRVLGFSDPAGLA